MNITFMEAAMREVKGSAVEWMAEPSPARNWRVDGHRVPPRSCIFPVINRSDERKFRAAGRRAATRKLSARRDPAALRGQLADQPIGLQRVGEPGLGPAVLDAGLDRARADALAVAVEEGKLAARLVEAAREPGALRGVRRTGRHRADLLQRPSCHAARVMADGLPWQYNRHAMPGGPARQARCAHAGPAGQFRRLAATIAKAGLPVGLWRGTTGAAQMTRDRR